MNNLATVTGLMLVALSFLGPGFPLLVVGAVAITLGGVLQVKKH